MPLCRELKYLSLAFEGLQKKKEYEIIKNKLECGIGKENIISSKATLWFRDILHIGKID